MTRLVALKCFAGLDIWAVWLVCQALLGCRCQMALGRVTGGLPLVLSVDDWSTPTFIVTREGCR